MKTLDIRAYIQEREKFLKESVKKYDDIIKKHLDKCNLVIKYDLSSLEVALEVDTTDRVVLASAYAHDHRKLNEKFLDVFHKLINDLKIKGTTRVNEFITEINFNSLGKNILDVSSEILNKVKENSPEANVFLRIEKLNTFKKKYYEAYGEFLSKIEQEEGSEFIDQVYRNKKVKNAKPSDKTHSLAHYYATHKYTGD